ncbi:MAG: AAA family ATPase, partial [Verrucomicrobiaceae bacterium]|nr:AAA family ATPase [Verrucomicrobiaceae bacterium]
MAAGQEQKRQQLQTAIAGLEAQRSMLGEAVVEPALAALRRELGELADAAAQATSGDERKLVTIMFADISGYTAMAEKLDPERARDLLNECFDALVPIVQRYGGTIDKFVGDEIMALFGAPVTHEDDAKRACSAALEMMERIDAFNTSNNADLGLHFGINSGRVLAGKVGSRDRHDYSVMGHAVNLASRLEDASSRGEIFVGEQTQRLTAPFFQFEEITLEVQGASNPVTAFRLLRARESTGRARGIAGLSSPLVGRETEVETLRTVTEGLRSGRGMVAALIGDAGVGKSRLIAEARSAATDVSWREGRTLSHTSGMSYWLARDLLRNVVGLDGTSNPETAAQSLWHRVVEETTSETGARAYPFLARLLDLPLEPTVESRLRELTAEALQRQTVEAVAAFLLAAARKKPLVLVCEDLHWADPSSLQMLAELLGLTSRAPLAFLFVLRPENEATNEFLHAAAKQLGEQFVRLELQPLSPEASECLLQNLLKIEELPAELKVEVLQKTEGNAFFLEEVLRSLIDSGAILIQDGHAVFQADLRRLHVPDTVQGVLASRLDGLSTADKNTLQTAAVLGRVFDELLLSRVVAENVRGEGLCRSLNELVLREFLRETTPAGDGTLDRQEASPREYIFKHALTHEVSYESLLLARRKELHHRAAEAIEELAPDKLDAQAAILGAHYAKAEVPEKATGYLALAGDSAAKTYANTEAIAFYGQALEQISLVRPGAENYAEHAARLHERSADLLELIGRHEAAREGYAHAGASAPVLARATRARLFRKTAKTFSAERDYAEALRQYALAEESLGDPESFAGAEWEEWIDAGLERLFAYYFRNEIDKMDRSVTAIRKQVELSGTPRQQAMLAERIVVLRYRKDGCFPSDETVALARRSLESWKAAGELGPIGEAHFLLGFVYVSRGEADAAEEQLRAAEAICHRTGDLVLLARVLTYLAMAARWRRDVSAARAEADRLTPIVSQYRMPEYAGMVKATYAWIA